MQTHANYPPDLPAARSADVLPGVPNHMPSLKEFVGLAELLPHVECVFGTQDSIRWFSRVHRKILSEYAAVIFVTGRLLYHPERFEQCVAEIGRLNLVGDPESEAKATARDE